MYTQALLGKALVFLCAVFCVHSDLLVSSLPASIRTNIYVLKNSLHSKTFVKRIIILA